MQQTVGHARGRRTPLRLGNLSSRYLPRTTPWQRHLDGLTSARLLAPSVALGFALLLLGLLPWLDPEPEVLGPALGTTALLGGLLALGILLARLHDHLVQPLAQVRHWALRMRGGNLGARVTPPDDGEFAELARDINSLSEELQNLSRDMDERVRTHTRRLAQKTRSLEILYDVAASINVSRDLDDLLTRFLYTLMEVTDARAASVRMLTDDNKMRLIASKGFEPAAMEHERLVPVSRCLCGKAADEGKILCQKDLLECSRYAGCAVVKDDGDMEMLAVPLQYRAKTLGVYNLFLQHGELVLSPDMEELLTSIGRHLGMAIEKARLDQESRRLYVMQERTALAHELHDSLAQTIASLRFQVQVLSEILQQRDTEAAEDELLRIRNSVDEAHTELRELLVHFRAPTDERGLVPALEDIIMRFRHETGINAVLQRDCGSAGLPALHEIQVLRIVQEALTNIRKHSQAQTVRVLMRCGEDAQYRVLIEDDGVGLGDPALGGHPGEHVGLSIMMERAQRLGGLLRIESEPGEGTRVELTFRHPNAAPAESNVAVV